MHDPSPGLSAHDPLRGEEVRLPRVLLPLPHLPLAIVYYSSSRFMIRRPHPIAAAGRGLITHGQQGGGPPSTPPSLSLNALCITPAGLLAPVCQIRADVPSEGLRRQQLSARALPALSRIALGKWIRESPCQLQGPGSGKRTTGVPHIYAGSEHGPLRIRVIAPPVESMEYLPRRDVRAGGIPARVRRRSNAAQAA